jgi:hypothetical protein
VATNIFLKIRKKDSTALSRTRPTGKSLDCAVRDLASGHVALRASLPDLIRQSILLRRLMDTRVILREDALRAFARV